MESKISPESSKRALPPSAVCARSFKAATFSSTPARKEAAAPSVEQPNFHGNRQVRGGRSVPEAPSAFALTAISASGASCGYDDNNDEVVVMMLRMTMRVNITVSFTKYIWFA